MRIFKNFPEKIFTFFKNRFQKNFPEKILQILKKGL